MAPHVPSAATNRDRTSVEGSPHVGAQLLLSAVDHPEGHVFVVDVVGEEREESLDARRPAAGPLVEHVLEPGALAVDGRPPGGGAAAHDRRENQPGQDIPTHDLLLRRQYG
jgi:hypothetical protein